VRPLIGDSTGTRFDRHACRHFGHPGRIHGL